MATLKWMSVALIALLMFPMVAQSDSVGNTIEIAGDVPHPLTVSADQIRIRPHLKLEVTEHGKKISYSGVSLSDLLHEAGTPSGPALKGKALTSYVLAQARDGYQVLFALAEFDPAFTDKQVLLADSADGKPLSESQGPLRLVVSGEKKPARSIRMLAKITVVQLSK